MSNEAPERYYKLKGHSELMPENLLESYDKIEASYIRDDLFGQHCKLRRREMFEKVALACLEGAGAPNFDFFVNHTIPAVRKIVDEILSEADKFARGEK